jgi:Ca-activated chloride channel family protein
METGLHVGSPVSSQKVPMMSLIARKELSMPPNAHTWQTVCATDNGRRMISLWFVLLLAAALSYSFFLTTPVRAQGLGLEKGLRASDVGEGSLLLRTQQKDLFIPAPVLKTDVELKVTGFIVRGNVRQRFHNPSTEWAEGIYVFPLPEEAAVDHLRIRIGERMIEGIIKERAEAKKTYESAKAEGKRTSLVEQERPNIFTTSVANIGPGEEIVVEIEYQQTLAYDQGQFRLRFPMVVGPRYVPGSPIEEQSKGYGWAKDTTQVPDASRITPWVQKPSKRPINPVILKIQLAAGFPLAKLESAYHKIKVMQEGVGQYEIALDEGMVPANRDFELMWQPIPSNLPTAAVFTEQKDGELFALFMVLPPQPSALEQHRVPRETVFVIDTSGSMHGASIEQAKAALRLALSRLRPQDSFNIIQFNSVTQVLFSGSVLVTKANFEKAVRYVDHLTAQGGTEMLPALQRALNGIETAGRLRQIIFLTDGAVGNEDQLFAMIRQHLGESRLFTIGIGSAPNSHFMRKAAEFGRGSFTYIGSTTEVQDKMDVLFRKLEHPALTDAKLAWSSSTEADMLPNRIPDLYLGEPLRIVVKGSSLPDSVALEGRFGPTPWRQELSLRNSENREGVSVYWARQKIASLMDKQKYGTEDDSIRHAVIQVAVQHHLVSRYTSLVAVDLTPARPADKNLQSHGMKTNLPEGWDYIAVFGLPQTGTPAPLQIVLGLLALFLAGLLYQLRCRRV